ncbi:MAG: hypothetical protein IT440_11195, partial [Phycisphaeraceae bacterium]|nr:hypothetical protein [Phycisphaeraceae bacterium]
MMQRAFVLAVVLSMFSFMQAVAAEPATISAPAELDDPANSLWITFGGDKPVAQQHGLFVGQEGEEGLLESVLIEGQQAARSLILVPATTQSETPPQPRPGMFYLRLESPEYFRGWLREGEAVLLTLRYWDGGPGTMLITYDSSDPRVHYDPYPSGVWKRPDEFKDGLQLTGDKQWHVVRCLLPMAAFLRREHGSDLRIQSTGEYALSLAALTRVPAAWRPDLVTTQALRVAEAQGMVAAGRGARFAGTFAQKDREPIVMEAELATTLCQQSGDYGPVLDDKASGGACIHWVEMASWTFTVKTPGKYVCWQRGKFPRKAGWLHNQFLDDGQVRDIHDCCKADQTLDWQGIDCGEYDLTAGQHELRQNYCNGPWLDAVVWLPKGEKLPDSPAALASSYVGPSRTVIQTTLVRPLDVARWQQVS